MSQSGRILVTGCNGFVGRNLVRALYERHGEGQVYGIDLDQESPLLPTERYFQVDIAQAGSCEAALQVIRPAAVYHLAAITSHRLVDEDRDRAVAVNIRGTGHMCQALSRFHCETSDRPVFLLASSSEVYGNPVEPGVINEKSALGRGCFYGMTKQHAEARAKIAARGSCLDVRIARPTNHIGPDQDGPFLVPDTIRQIQGLFDGDGSAPFKITNPKATRDFMHVQDVVEGYIRFAEAGVHTLPADRTLVFASGRSTSVRDVKLACLEAAGLLGHVRIEELELDDPSAGKQVSFDPSLARECLGWTAAITHRLGMSHMVHDIWEARTARTVPFPRLDHEPGISREQARAV